MASSPSSSASPGTSSVAGTLESTTDKILDGEIDTTDTKARYLALLGRARPVLLPAARYLAYTSDIGEAFRPVVNRRVVTAGYGISIAYVVGDVGFEGYKASLDRKERLAASSALAAVTGEKGTAGKGAGSEPSAATEIGLRVARRTVFQGLASIILPAITIHSAVKYSAPLFLKSQNPRIKGWGPTVVGLAIVPALPVLFDHPVETATDKVFDYVEENWLQLPEAVRNARRQHGHEHGKAKGEL